MRLTGLITTRAVASAAVTHSAAMAHLTAVVYLTAITYSVAVLVETAFVLRFQLLFMSILTINACNQTKTVVAKEIFKNRSEKMAIRAK